MMSLTAVVPHRTTISYVRVHVYNMYGNIRRRRRWKRREEEEEKEEEEGSV